MSDPTEYATGGYVSGPATGDAPLALNYGCSGIGYLVPVDFGIRIPRDDVQVVLLDAEPVPDHIAHALNAIGGLLGTPKRTEPKP
ncbi:MAG TPA: hypothetical protein VGD91_24965 [Trebonia sp.]